MDRDLNLKRAETFSFVNPWIRYFLFFFSFLFWNIDKNKATTQQQQKEKRKYTKNELDQVEHKVFSLLIIAIGVYAKIQKATDTVRDTFLIDPAVILIVVGVVMFFITFCGCIGALRENIRLLKTFSLSLTLVFITQLVIAVLGFFYSDQTRDALGEFVKKAIVHYRDDLDLQNLMDYIQKEFKCCGWNDYKDWSWNLYFNCTRENPSSERCAVPYSCCTPVPGEAVINTMCGFGVQTQKFLEANKSIYPVGCADKAVLWIETHLLLVGALALGLALPQIAGIVLSQILISQIQDEIGSVL